LGPEVGKSTSNQGDQWQVTGAHVVPGEVVVVRVVVGVGNGVVVGKAVVVITGVVGVMTLVVLAGVVSVVVVAPVVVEVVPVEVGWGPVVVSTSCVFVKKGVVVETGTVGLVVVGMGVGTHSGFSTQQYTLIL